MQLLSISYYVNEEPQKSGLNPLFTDNAQNRAINNQDCKIFEREYKDVEEIKNIIDLEIEKARTKYGLFINCAQFFTYPAV